MVTKEQIDRYIDNLDVNTQVDLLKKIMSIWFETDFDIDKFIEEMRFFKQQILEFNEKYPKGTSFMEKIGTLEKYKE